MVIRDRTGVVWIDNLIKNFLMYAIRSKYNTSSGARDCCDVASEEFQNFVLAYKAPAETIRYKKEGSTTFSDYPYEKAPGCIFHDVVKVDCWFIDWTARQFDPEAPFPAVWKEE